VGKFICNAPTSESPHFNSIVVPYKVGGAFTGLEKLPKKEENKMEPRDGSIYLDIIIIKRRYK